MFTFCIVLVLIASVLVILAVLVQSPKSGMAANFGASNQVMGVRQTADFLEKFTWTMAAAILVLSLLATLAMDREKLSSGHIGNSDAAALREHSQGGDAPMQLDITPDNSYEAAAEEVEAAVEE